MHSTVGRHSVNVKMPETIIYFVLEAIVLHMAHASQRPTFYVYASPVSLLPSSVGRMSLRPPVTGLSAGDYSPDLAI